MSLVPLLSYREIVHALQRDGWVVLRQRGSHIRMEKRAGGRMLKLTVPAHNPVKRSTLSHILDQARLLPDAFAKLL